MGGMIDSVRSRTGSGYGSAVAHPGASFPCGDGCSRVGSISILAVLFLCYSRVVCAP